VRAGTNIARRSLRGKPDFNVILSFPDSNTVVWSSENEWHVMKRPTVPE
jgi:hypothetical protein